MPREGIKDSHTAHTIPSYSRPVQYEDRLQKPGLFTLERRRMRGILLRPANSYMASKI